MTSRPLRSLASLPAGDSAAPTSGDSTSGRSVLISDLRPPPSAASPSQPLNVEGLMFTSSRENESSARSPISSRAEAHAKRSAQSAAAPLASDLRPLTSNPTGPSAPSADPPSQPSDVERSMLGVQRSPRASDSPLPPLASDKATPPWQPMTMDQYAALQLRFGARLCQKEGNWWRRIRPFFYRPLLSHEPLDDRVVPSPCRWPVAFQYRASDSGLANSTLNFLVYDHLSEYTLNSMNRHRQKQIRKASEEFQVRPIADWHELSERGYAAYLSFYQRTGYGYKAERIDRTQFEKWAATFRDFPQVILLGAYTEEGLAAASVAYWVKETLIYASIFSETEAMRKNVASLLLHELRTLAASLPGMTQILARSYQGGSTLDRFYLDRGCKLLRTPANLVLNPLASAAIRLCLPRQYVHLTGNYQ